jgi:hypothetical protein
METGGDQWDVISLPALAEEDDPLGRAFGEPLWPEWESLEELERKRRAVGPREWSALYQQRPAPEEGDYFNADWLKSYDKVPARDILRVYGASDYAVTADGGDFTCHVVVGVDPEGRMYVLDLWRKQASSDAWIEAFCDLVNLWKLMMWAEEQGQIKAGVGPFSTAGSVSVRLMSSVGPSPPEGTKQFVLNPFEAAWLLRDSIYRQEQHGCLPLGQSC